MYNNLSVGDNYTATIKDQDGISATLGKAAIEGDAFTFGAAYKVGAFTPRAKVNLTQYKNRIGSGTNEWKKDSMSFALGVDYALGKNTKVYAEYANLDKHNRNFVTSKNNNTERTDSNAFSVGFFHKF
jgi:predicted porin